ncbi:hypothetical protein L1277_001536 [Okibacterium sp. HSC-33S16]|uniref:hypothetical protein n=1 Tax=Okibacterium sp. HSC-33S16 TaxID=2910965 RepID=UPI00209E8503|nr:hypothetical protein [Okibacterium sp. HSC-33S16]MCP2031445.1 hypothetical protein [Okibacterium sp. HSC-33S16]
MADWSMTVAGTALAVLTIVVVVVASPTPASAEHRERTLHMTRVDGAPIGALFDDWVMVPGDKASTTVVANRTGGGVSSLAITLGNGNTRAASAAALPIEENLLITAEVNGLVFRSSAASLMQGDAVFDLGRSTDPAVPIDVTFELPFESGNNTQQQPFDLSLVVTAADVPTSADSRIRETTLPLLPGTGASVRDILIAAGALTMSGLLLLGGRQKRRERQNAS